MQMTRSPTDFSSASRNMNEIDRVIAFLLPHFGRMRKDIRISSIKSSEETLDFVLTYLKEESQRMDEIQNSKVPQKSKRTTLSVKALEEIFFQRLIVSLDYVIELRSQQIIQVDFSEKDISSLDDINDIIDAHQKILTMRSGGDFIVLYSYYLEGVLCERVSRNLSSNFDPEDLDVEAQDELFNSYLNMSYWTSRRRLLFKRLLDMYVKYLVIFIHFLFGYFLLFRFPILFHCKISYTELDRYASKILKRASKKENAEFFKKLTSHSQKLTVSIKTEVKERDAKTDDLSVLLKDCVSVDKEYQKELVQKYHLTSPKDDVDDEDEHELLKKIDKILLE